MTKLDTNTANAIANAIGRNVKIQSVQSISGGDINAAFRLQSTSDSYFVKLNQANRHGMFEAELAGLQALAETETVTVPKPLVHGVTDKVSFLVLEYFALNRQTSTSERLLGEQLAQLHLQRQPYFGWHIDNTIGSTSQVNPQTDDWITFWRQSRLNFQLNLVGSQRLALLGEQLSERLGDFFQGYTPLPSLLHGDLWGGNAASLADGTPVMFDPACYFGDRETDLAMTELFGGFGQGFYAAYNGIWQLDSGYRIRKNLYNLYHILNHAVLFGGGYVSQAEKMMRDLLSEVQ
jgi:fructosamine-3-kinase